MSFLNVQPAFECAACNNFCQSMPGTTSPLEALLIESLLDDIADEYAEKIKAVASALQKDITPDVADFKKKHCIQIIDLMRYFAKRLHPDGKGVAHQKAQAAIEFCLIDHIHTIAKKIHDLFPDHLGNFKEEAPESKTSLSQSIISLDSVSSGEMLPPAEQPEVALSCSSLQSNASGAVS